MEDLTKKTYKKDNASKEASKTTPQATGKSKENDHARIPRRSEIQTQVNPRAMLDKVLNTPITLAVGELLAVSKEMAQQV